MNICCLLSYLLCITFILGTRGPPGDLYVCLDVEEIPEIKRDGINLRSTVSINYIEAILGTTVEVNLELHHTFFFINSLLSCANNSYVYN